MFYIIKGREPASLTQYKKSKEAYFDGFPYKDDIRQSLLEEQGYLCAYCMRRIKSINEVTIEHYLPQSKTDTATGLDYRYMLGVCKRNRECAHKNQTCDAHRNNEPLTVNPWSQASISLISYHQNSGDIFSNDKNIDKDLNITLNLNCADARLSLGRKEALESLKNFILKGHKTGTWNKSILLDVREHYSTKNADGMYMPYIGIILWYIDKRINKLASKD